MQLPSHEIRRSLGRAACRWNPAPVPAPGIDPQIGRRPALERAAKVLVYQIQSFEYSLFPKGELRAWLRICLRISLILALPALFVMPALIVLATGLADITAAGASICLSLLKIVVYVVITAAILVAVVKAVTSHRGRY
jgi:hypothetical protein